MELHEPQNDISEVSELHEQNLVLEVRDWIIGEFFFDEWMQFFYLGHLVGEQLVHVITLRNEIVVLE